MPSANGVYSLPPGYLAVTGQVIQAIQHNPPLEDIAAALTGRLSRDGSAPMTGALRLAAGAVGFPGVTFSTDLTSGFYKTTNGVGVAIGGSKVAEFLPGGVVGALAIGMIFPWIGTAAPPLFVLPYGQTLSRTAYADLWAFAQVEIAAGNTFFNNGDGSTTFGIGDLRGRVLAGRDNMGGSAASRLTSTYFGGTATNLGATGGLESHTLTTAQLASHGHGITDPGHTHSLNNGASIYSNGVTGQLGGTGNNEQVAGIASATTGITVNSAGSGNAHNNVQPTIIMNYILFAGA